MAHRPLVVVLGLALGCVLPSQSGDDKPLRVHIIGASVSGGFRDGPLFGAEEQGDSVTLQRVVKRWADGEARVTTHNIVDMTRFFMDPLVLGEKQIDFVKRVNPDIVIAVDFPFWFAYGYMRGDDEAKARKERLAKGLAMLGELDMPILLGDLPNMRGAARRMISPRQIPSVELLAELNDQIAAFAAERDNVQVVELSGIVHRMRDEGIALPLQDGPIETPKGALQQADRLHVTRLGMAFLGFTLQDALCGVFPVGHPLRGRDWGFEQFVEAAGAEDELEEFVEAAAQKTGPGKR